VTQWFRHRRIFEPSEDAGSSILWIVLGTPYGEKGSRQEKSKVKGEGVSNVGRNQGIGISGMLDARFKAVGPPQADLRTVKRPQFYDIVDRKRFRGLGGGGIIERVRDSG